MNKQEKRCARIHALKVAYAYEMTDSKVNLESNFFDLINKQIDNVDPIISYARELVNEYVNHIQEFDDLIVSKSSNWDISRIAFIDRIIIRLALTEMYYFKDVPAKVSIVEAVEISKEYSTDDSSSFINGILDSIYNEEQLV